MQVPCIASISSASLLTLVAFCFGVVILLLILSTRAKAKVIRHLQSEIQRENSAENVTYEQIDEVRRSMSNQRTIHTAENVAYEHIKIRQL